MESGYFSDWRGVKISLEISCKTEIWKNLHVSEFVQSCSCFGCDRKITPATQIVLGDHTYKWHLPLLFSHTWHFHGAPHPDDALHNVVRTKILHSENFGPLVSFITTWSSCCSWMSIGRLRLSSEEIPYYCVCIQDLSLLNPVNRSPSSFVSNLQGEGLYTEACSTNLKGAVGLILLELQPWVWVRRLPLLSDSYFTSYTVSELQPWFWGRRLPLLSDSYFTSYTVSEVALTLVLTVTYITLMI